MSLRRRRHRIRVLALGVAVFLIAGAPYAPHAPYANEGVSVAREFGITVREPVAPAYATRLASWEATGFRAATAAAAALSFDGDAGAMPVDPRSSGVPAAPGDATVYRIEADGELGARFEVERPGLYEISFTYYPVDDRPLAPEVYLRVNGGQVYEELRRIVLPVRWQSTSDEPLVDRYGNEIPALVRRVDRWYSTRAVDATGRHLLPLRIALESGTHDLSVGSLQGPVLISDLRLEPPADLPPHEDYLDELRTRGVAPPAGRGDSQGGERLRVEAEAMAWRNTSSVRPASSRDPEARPNDTRRRLLNVVDGASWQQGGEAIGYRMEVPVSGFYRPAVAFRQTDAEKLRSPVYRSIRIDGRLLFTEAAAWKIPPAAGWRVEVFPHEIYLEAGEVELELAVVLDPVQPVIASLEGLLRDIRVFSVAVRRLTGNVQDEFRDWDMDRYFPDLSGTLRSWATVLRNQVGHLLGEAGANRRSREVLSLEQAAGMLDRLAREPNEIPRNLNLLSEGSGSVAQILGDVTTLLLKQPLTTDAVFLVPDGEQAPDIGVGIFTRIGHALERFFLSFSPQGYNAPAEMDEDLRVWVRRPRQYVEVYQQLTDQIFTPETGIPVSYSLMPDENKLILANAAGTQPDAVMAVSNWVPFELALRGAAVDLNRFEDFPEVLGRFSPGAFLPFIVEDKVYALPETQDFWVAFYRTDIFDALGLSPPDTWQDVVEMLPVLKRFGMDFYTPLSAAAGLKPILATAPFIYQRGGELYRPDGHRTLIDQDAAIAGLRFMTELFTLYSMPLQTPSFYQHFRDGTIPIGIANFPAYVQITAAAPEIAGYWDIVPYPGIPNDAGEVVRWAPGSADSLAIIRARGREEDAWRLFEWWTSTETQLDFQTRLRTGYGPEYLWHSANIEAFSRLSIPPQHRDVVLEQWEWLLEVPRVPGHYMLEREISNLWNRVVFDGVNIRAAVDDAVVTINREISRKMEEFGYRRGDEITRPYPVPTLSFVESLQ